jgi:hypothetical protein
METFEPEICRNCIHRKACKKDIIDINTGKCKSKIEFEDTGIVQKIVSDIVQNRYNN